MNSRHVAVVALVGFTVGAPASDLFLKPVEYRVPADSKGVARVLNGTIEKSRNAVEWSRVDNAAIATSEGRKSVAAERWSVQGDAAQMEYAVGSPGTYVLGVSTRPKVVEFTPEQFELYLTRYDLSAADRATDTMEKKDLSTIRERYAKHARAVFQVGEVRTDGHRVSLDQPVELIVDHNPYELKFGKELSFQALVDGEPQPDLAVRAGCEGFHGHDASGQHISHYDLRTDEQGRASFLLSQKCVWYISTIALRPAATPDADYESHWATVTFEIF